MQELRDGEQVISSPFARGFEMERSVWRKAGENVVNVSRDWWPGWISGGKMKREDGANMEGMEDLNKRTWRNRLEFINRTDKSSRSSAIRAFIYLWRTIRRGGARAADRKESRPQITMAASNEGYFSVQFVNLFDRPSRTSGLSIRGLSRITSTQEERG